MSDAVVTRLADGTSPQKLLELVDEHKLLVAFVIIEIASIAGGLALDGAGKAELAGIVGSVALLAPILWISVVGFLKVLKLLTPYLRTAQ